LFEAFSQLALRPPARSLSGEIGAIHRELLRGHTLTESFAAARAKVTAFDLALIEAGETSGRLDRVFRELSQHHRDSARFARRALGGIAYPFFLMHLALIIFPMQRLTDIFTKGDLTGFVVQKIIVFGLIYSMIFVGLWLTQGSRGEGLRAALEKVFHFVPQLGGARQSQALSRMAAALGGLFAAGVDVIRSWETAAEASGSPALKRAVSTWRRRIESGERPSEILLGTPEFPQRFVSLYTTGEASGKLDASLEHLHRHYAEEAARKFTMFLVLLSGVVFGSVALAVAYQVISFWLGYFDQINEVMK
jgi:type II secretory pathway component PulF